MTFEQAEQYRPTAEELRTRFLNGEIEPDDFLDGLFELDQSTPDRAHARQNLAALTSEDVAKRFEETGTSEAYHNLVSLSAFHIGQDEALSGVDPTAALSKSLEAAEKAGNKEWTAYVQATLAYFSNDSAALEHALDDMGEGTNKTIIQNLLDGLKTRGRIDYPVDYHA